MEPATLINTRVEVLYLDLLKKSLTRAIASETFSAAEPWFGIMRWWFLPLQLYLKARGWTVVQRVAADPKMRSEGRDWPVDAETMVGLRRLDSLQSSLERVLQDDVPGDVIETGVWRGGASIFMRGVLKAYGDTDRIVWVADSFQGLPKPQPGVWRDDEQLDLSRFKNTLAVPLEQVRANFERYGLLDDQVRFIPGWFSDTLPSAPIERLALLRLDGDMYQSTMDALRALYPKLSTGGYCIIDDYYSQSGARQAVTEYRQENGITDSIEQIDWTGAFWRRA
ncbi:MAG TPA: TylF/MycF/NovP-related O-methyltransferase [Vicinamibacterales bacterium]|jgi:O-methyltransferase|nr:TylF/MycF/NovP-related O-methyltransferase [Vicinamibacterales bacterium]